MSKIEVETSNSIPERTGMDNDLDTLVTALHVTIHEYLKRNPRPAHTGRLAYHEKQRNVQT
ncbi:hypothetical protein G7067_04665 [Leucobacter insecticola]|uniref:Uncharacterized protein n=1 Tax=Leucobacter insecticola TaxID=2714934 RepID=A0A6G8FHN2_9MICO|nr:hypothetical protein [Leucobacter insecticola]QIM15867.1 hypothetical protein G7067_04665 [Leucobacter insecticola]